MMELYSFCLSIAYIVHPHHPYIDDSDTKMYPCPFGVKCATPLWSFGGELCIDLLSAKT